MSWTVDSGHPATLELGLAAGPVEGILSAAMALALNAQLIARPLAARLGGGATYNPCVLYLAQVGFEHWLIDLLASFGSK